MLSKSEFDDQLLTHSFYQALFSHFYQACDRAIQVLLQDCTFGIAPNQAGTKTFFIVAPDQTTAEALIEKVHAVLNYADAVMAGINQTAICFVPVERQAEYQAYQREQKAFSPKFVLGKIFQHPQKAETASEE